MRIGGFSTSWRDAVAVGAMVGGTLLALMSSSIGGAVFAPTQSHVLGVSTVIGVMLIGFTMVVGGISYLLSAQRNYRYSTHETERVEVVELERR